MCADWWNRILQRKILLFTAGLLPWYDRKKQKSIQKKEKNTKYVPYIACG